MYKQCKCKQHEGDRLLPITSFFKHKTRPDGRTDTCKICHKRQVQANRLANLTAAREAGRRYYAQHKEQQLTSLKQTYHTKKTNPDFVRYQMLCNAKDRAKNKNIPFDILLEDIILPDVCPVLGIPLTRGAKTATDNSPTLDRIDSTKGYVKGNVHVISKRANTIKNCGTPDEHRRIYEYFSLYESTKPPNV